VSLDVNKLDALILLGPFLAVIRSPATSGPITALALAAVSKFLTYRLVHADSPSLPLALAHLSNAATHCKFEASDSVSDEVVLLKILDLLEDVLDSRDFVTVLSDEAICEMMETGLSMCCQMRLSGTFEKCCLSKNQRTLRVSPEMLRRSAERTMQVLVSAVFRELRYLDPSGDEELLSASLIDGGSNSLRVGAPDPTSTEIPTATGSDGDRGVVNGTVDGEKEGINGTQGPSQGEASEMQPSSSDKISPFGLPAIKEVLRALISLLDPLDTQHTDSMRFMALGVLNVVLEVGGKSIGRFPSLRAMFGDQACRHLFQVCQTSNPPVSCLSG
jgi:brefeldin A-resistance guanine nucleotide exchange factor 1